MAIVGTAEVLIRAVDTGFEAELKAKVGAAVDKTSAATKGVAIRADSKALESDLAAAETKYKGFAGRIAGLFSGTKLPSLSPEIDGAKAEKAAAGIVTQLRQVTGAVGGLPGAEKVETITAGLLRMEAAGKTSALALAGLGPIVLAVVGAAALLKGAADFSSLTAEIRGVQRVMGGTAQEASTVVAVTKVLGLETNTVALALFRFSNNLDINKQKLAGYGVEVVRNNKGQADTFATLEKLADAYKATQDPIEKTRLLQIAFGRGGKDMAVLLAGGSERLRELQEEAKKAGVILGGDALEQGRQFGLATRSMGEAVKGLSVQLGGPVIGLLTSFAGSVTTVITTIDKVHPGLASGLIQVGVVTLVAGKALGYLAERAVVATAAETAAAVAADALAASAIAAGGAEALAAVGTDAWIVSLEALTASEGAATVASAGFFATAAAGFASIPIVGQAAIITGAMVLMSRFADNHVGVLKAVDKGAVDLESHIPIIGRYGAALDRWALGLHKTKDGVKELTDEEKKQKALEDAEANAQAAASVSLPGAIEAVSTARAAAAITTANATAAEKALGDAQQNVSDLQVSFAEQAASAKAAYAEKAASANRAVIDSERSLAEVIRSTNQKIADDEKSLADAQLDSIKAVADAQAAANKANLDAHRAVRDAEGALSDERARQNAGGNQALLRQMAAAGTITSLTRAAADARAKEAETQAKGADSVTKAQTDGLTKVQVAQQALDRDRADSARQVETAERSVADAKTAQNKVALEGLHIGERTTAQERQMRDAVDKVAEAQAALTAARDKDAKDNAKHEQDIIDALVNEEVIRDRMAGKEDDDLTKKQIRLDKIHDQLKTLDPSSPEYQNLLGISLIAQGIAKDFEDAAAQIATWKGVLSGLATAPGTSDAAARTQDQLRHALADLLAGAGGGGRMAGGPVWAGWSGLVGEAGPERLDMFRGGGGFVTPLSGAVPAAAVAPAVANGRNGPLIGQLVVQGATVAASYATGVETARAVRAAEYARSGR